MRPQIGSQMVRQTTVSNARKKRTVVVPNSYIAVASNVGDVSARLASAILHRHTDGWLMLALDEQALVLAAWSSSNAYQPLRTRYMSSDRMIAHLARLASRRPERGDGRDFVIRANDCSLLSLDASATRRWTIVAYESSLSELLRDLAILLRASTKNKESSRTRQASRRLPTYTEIRRLDPTITFEEYRAIYSP